MCNNDIKKLSAFDTAEQEINELKENTEEKLRMQYGETTGWK